MEGLAGASSIIAVVSLSIQLIDEIKKLNDFWGSMKGASEEVDFIINDLKIISEIASRIREDAESSNSHPKTTDLSLKALEQCSKKIDGLKRLIDKWEAGLKDERKKTRVWTAAKVTWKGESVRKFRQGLGEAKSTLILARQEASIWQNTLHHKVHEQYYEMITRVEEKQNKVQNSLFTIESMMQKLVLARCITTVSSSEMDGMEEEMHLMELKEKMAKATEAIDNPLVRYAVQKELEGLLPQMVHLGSPNLDYTAKENLKPRRGSRHQTKNLQQISKSQHVIKTVFGTLTFTSSLYTSNDDEDSEESSSSEESYQARTLVFLHPSQWLLRWGFGRGLSMNFNMSGTGLECSINPYRAVPDDSLVFEYCATGDINGVRDLFTRGLASPWDRNSEGWTPLFFAAERAQSEVCKMLIESGADIQARNKFNDSAALSACNGPTCFRACTHPKTVDQINTIRLFLQELQDTTDGFPGEGLSGLQATLYDGRCENCKNRQSPPKFNWLFPLLQPEIDTSIPAVYDTMTKILWHATEYPDTKALEQIIGAVGDVNRALSDGYLSPALHMAVGIQPQHSEQAFKVLVANDLDLHAVCRVHFLHRTPWTVIVQHHTPTSLAVRYSKTFHQWRRILRDNDINIPKFIAQELEVGQIQKDGWDGLSLSRLFELDFEPLPALGCSNSRCRRYESFWVTGREICWSLFLEELKRLPEDIDPSILFRNKRGNHSRLQLEDWTPCFECERELDGKYESEDETSEDEDSPFLLSIPI